MLQSKVTPGSTTVQSSCLSVSLQQSPDYSINRTGVYPGRYEGFACRPLLLPLALLPHRKIADTNLLVHRAEVNVFRFHGLHPHHI